MARCNKVVECNISSCVTLRCSMVGTNAPALLDWGIGGYYTTRCTHNSQFKSCKVVAHDATHTGHVPLSDDISACSSYDMAAIFHSMK